MSEEVKEQQVEEKPITQVLKDFDNAPSQEEIEKWKILHGEVFVSGFSPEELFIWRPIKRPEYRKIQEAAGNPEAPLDQMQVEEMVCDVCVLWKSVSKSWIDGKAGIPHTIADQVMLNSGFLSPQAASMLVAKL